VLGISADAILYASFGLINRNKCIDELMDAWIRSGLADKDNARLYLVGDCSDPTMRASIASWQRRLPKSRQFVVTGHVDNQTYDLFLAAADVAIQLRRDSRGESSAALLDCMGAGLATIVNDHGSASELPGECLLKIPNTFTVDELAEALQNMSSGSANRDDIGARARRHVARVHAPETVAMSYCEKMETAYRESLSSRLETLRHEIFGELLATVESRDRIAYFEQFEEMTRCLLTPARPLSGLQFLVDISPLMATWTEKSAQDYAQEILKALLAESDPEFRVEPVYFDDDSDCFRYARHYACQLLEITTLHLADDPVQASTGDILFAFGDDLFTQEINNRFRHLQNWRGRGVTVCLLSPGHEQSASEASVDTMIRPMDVCDVVLCPTVTDSERCLEWLSKNKRSDSLHPRIAVLDAYNLALEYETTESAVATTLLEHIVTGGWYDPRHIPK
jgi:hypothetical protein